LRIQDPHGSFAKHHKLTKESSFAAHEMIQWFIESGLSFSPVKGVQLARKLISLSLLVPLESSGVFADDVTMFKFGTGETSAAGVQFNTPPTESKTAANRRKFYSTMSITQFISETEAAQAFRSFLAANLCEENIDFYLAVNRLHDAKEADIPVICRDIYSRFIKPGAAHRVNLPDAEFTQADNALKSEKLTRTIFDRCQSHVLVLLENDRWKPFQSSTFFIDFLQRGANAYKTPKAKSDTPMKRTQITHSANEVPNNKKVDGKKELKKDDKDVKKEEKERRKEEGRQQRRRGRLHKIFERADKDSSGFLDVVEVCNMIKNAFKKKDLERLGNLPLIQFAQSQVKKYDKSGNGKIEFEEFMDFYEDLLEDPKLPDDLRQSSNAADDDEVD